jgi:hypothetical protein
MLARKSIEVSAEMPDLAYRPFSFLKQLSERARPGIQYKAIKHIERHVAVTLWPYGNILEAMTLVFSGEII